MYKRQEKLGSIAFESGHDEVFIGRTMTQGRSYSESVAAQIDEEVKLDRQAELMELQQDISAELGERRIGQELLVMIEGKVADEDAYVGRSQADAPGVDGYVFVNTPETLVSGDFVRVKITGALEYDLIGEISQ